MPFQTWEELSAAATASGTAFANTLTRTAYYGVVTLPANFWYVGRMVRVTAYVRYSTTSAPTLVFTIMIGSVVIALTEAITLGSSVTGLNGRIVCDMVCQSVGSSGTVLGMGLVTVNTNQGADPTNKTQVFSISGGDLPTPATVDTTVAGDITVNGTHGTQSSSNTTQGIMQMVEVLN